MDEQEEFEFRLRLEQEQAAPKSNLKQSNPAEYDPSSRAYQKKYGAASGGFGENWLAGAGKGFVDLARGIGQLTGNYSREQMDQVKAQDAALMRTGAGRFGNVVGSAAAAAPAAFIPGANTYTGAALIGSAFGGAQPVGTDDSRLLNTGVGAAGGMAGKYLGDKLVKGIASAVDDPVAANAATRQAGRKLDFRLTPGQATGNKALQRLEAALESKAFTAGPFDAIKDNNQAILNKTVLEAIGEKGTRVTSEVLDQADQRIGQVFASVADDAPRTINPDDFLQKFVEIEDSVDGLVTGFGENPLIKQVMDLASKGQATGKQLQGLTSKLGKAAYKQMTSPSGDRDLGGALYQVKDYVDEILESGMDAGKKQAFQQARQQYRALMMVTSRVGNINAGTGNVSGRSLAATLQSKDKKGFLYGRNKSDMYEAARFAREYQPIVGDSGTATRSQGPIDFVAGLPFGLASRIYASRPVTNALIGSQYAGEAGLRGLNPFLPYIPRYLPPIGAGSANALVE